MQTLLSCVIKSLFDIESKGVLLMQNLAAKIAYSLRDNSLSQIANKISTKTKGFSDKTKEFPPKWYEALKNSKIFGNLRLRDFMA